MQELPFKVEGIPYRYTEDKSVLYLLIKRTPQDGGYWQPVTGTLNDGEKLLDCLKRELREETGIKENQILSISDVLYKFDWKNKHGDTVLEFVYAIEYPEGLEIVLSPDEHDDYRWCTYDVAMETLFTQNNKNAFEIVNSFLTRR